MTRLQSSTSVPSQQDTATTNPPVLRDLSPASATYANNRSHPVGNNQVSNPTRHGTREPSDDGADEHQGFLTPVADTDDESQASTWSTQNTPDPSETGSEIGVADQNRVHNNRSVRPVMSSRGTITSSWSCQSTLMDDGCESDDETLNFLSTPSRQATPVPSEHAVPQQYGPLTPRHVAAAFTPAAAVVPAAASVPAVAIADPNMNDPQSEPNLSEPVTATQHHPLGLTSTPSQSQWNNDVGYRPDGGIFTSPALPDFRLDVTLSQTGLLRRPRITAVSLVLNPQDDDDDGDTDPYWRESTTENRTRTEDELREGYPSGPGYVSSDTWDDHADGGWRPSWSMETSTKE